ncbi:hypothetical protein LEP1GSC124_0422, partial [Leptospira interrogans serovar Pyrogenes str. 200701872]
LFLFLITYLIYWNVDVPDEKESFIRFFHRILRLFSYNVFDSFSSNNRDQLLPFC